MNELITIGFNAKITPVKPINDQFTLCKCFVMALGKNVNKTIISKEASDDALPSLFNIPVVGHLYIDEDGTLRAGGHDMVLEKGEDGKFRFKAITVPYGVVPQQDNVHYEEVEEKDGTKNTYLVADIILWTGRYPELYDAIYSEDIYFAQSMEIMPFDTSKSEEGLDVKKFQYSALCLLGKSDDASKNVAPCFASARVEPYKFSEADKWTELFGEFKEQLAKSYSAADVVKGGKEALNTETIKRILLEFGLAEDTVLSFEVAEDMTEDELKAKIQEVYCKDNQEGAPAVEPNEEPTEGAEEQPAEPQTEGENYSEQTEQPVEETPAEPVTFSVDLTYEEKRKGLNEALSLYNICNEEAYAYYCLVDFDESFVYSYYHIDGKNIASAQGNIRIPYTFVDDKPVLNMNSNEKVRQVWLTKADEDKITAEKEYLAELKEYKACKEKEEKRKCYTEVISEFAELGEVDEYKAVVKDAMTFESVEALREKLYAIRGRNTDKVTKKSLGEIRIPVGFESKSKQSEYDEFMSKYLAPKK